MPEPFFIQLNNKPGWSRAPERVDDPCALEEIAKDFNRKRGPHTYHVCGLLTGDSQHWLYRVETGDPIEIVRTFEVGTHAEISYGESALPKVLQQMMLVHARNPIVPFFADPAGLKCTFEQPLSAEFADFLESVINEGVEAYADEEEGYVGPAVLREGILRLWWD
jgi:hypothetical protein